MAANANIWVVHHDGEQRWWVRREGVEEPLSRHATQDEAHEAGRAVARADGVELIVQGRDGRIVAKDSFGNDPRSIPG